MKKIKALLAFLLIGMLCADAPAQSSSLYKRRHRSQESSLSRRDSTTPLSAAIAETSFVASPLPEPRSFAVHDLVTVIIRESILSDSDASLETEKSVTFEGEISEFPNLRMRDLLNFQLTPSSFDDGRPQLNLEFDGEFDGSGERSRNDRFITRVTAQIIDVKPNGTLVLEGRKYLKTDKETTQLLVTGTCRPEDITVDNTILSTEMADFNLTNEHKGELRNATKKGWLTKLFEAIFNF